MPYVPSEKTNPPAEDRKIIDVAVEVLANKAAAEIKSNLSVIEIYKDMFSAVSEELFALLEGVKRSGESPEAKLAAAIYEIGAKYGYDGAYLGEFNYGLTRFIQRVPQIKIASGKWKPTDEFRYWFYAATASALTQASRFTEDLDIGVDGVFEDVKDEYKRRVNTAYEAEQILKSGDCYDTPYYTRLVRVVDEGGNLIGHMEVMLKRDASTLHKDLLDGEIVLKSKTP